jgi:hypothetical protein
MTAIVQREQRKNLGQELKWVNLISKKGNTYRRRRWCCNHCGKEMTGAVNANDFA